MKKRVCFKVELDLPDGADVDDAGDYIGRALRALVRSPGASAEPMYKLDIDSLSIDVRDPAVENVSLSRDELLKLRTGLARLAFAMGLGRHVPGTPAEAFEHIARAAEANERGWNALIAHLLDAIAEPRVVVRTVKFRNGSLHESPLAIVYDEETARSLMKDVTDATPKLHDVAPKLGIVETGAAIYTMAAARREEAVVSKRNIVDDELESMGLRPRDAVEDKDED